MLDQAIEGGQINASQVATAEMGDKSKVEERAGQDDEIEAAGH